MLDDVEAFELLDDLPDHETRNKMTLTIHELQNGIFCSEESLHIAFMAEKAHESEHDSERSHGHYRACVNSGILIMVAVIDQMQRTMLLLTRSLMPNYDTVSVCWFNTLQC